MDDNMRKAFAEVYDIIYHMDGELIDLIPDDFLDMVENEMDEDYDVNIDYDKNLNDQDLLPETRAIITIVYRDYLCDEAEKEKLDNMIFNEIEKELELTDITPGTYNSLEERFASLGMHQSEDSTLEKQVKEIAEETALSASTEHQSFFKKIFSFFKKRK